MSKNAITHQSLLRANLPVLTQGLVVDDNLHDFEVISRYLDSIDHTEFRLDHADSIRKAEQLVLANEYDIVLLDYRMSGEQGLSFLAVMAQHKIDLPAIMISDLNSIDVDLQGLFVGCLDYLPKSEITAGNLERSIRYAINNHRIFKELTHVASHDHLTQLPNRMLFFDRLEQMLKRVGRSKVPCAIIAFDLDDFKAINDQYGHPAGDAVLEECAQRLLGSVRAADTVARIGGDEFMLLLEDVDRHTAEVITKKIIAVMSQPIDIGEASVVCQGSIGICLIPYQEQEEEGFSSGLIQKVDKALYSAKSANKGHYVFSE